MSVKVGIIGAGPGGLAAGVLLRNKGFEVDIFEAADRVGGRNAVLRLGDFHFDVGPTFFLMPQILEEVFHACGRSMSDYLQVKRVDPMYGLDFGAHGTLKTYGNPFEMSREIAKLSKRDADAFWRYRERQKNKFDAILPALQQSFQGWGDLVRVQNLSAVPYLNTSSVYDELQSFFEDERVRLAFTFQAKYLGMSPFDCPSLFTILPHIEHQMGVWHPVGGCNQVSVAMAKLFEELGGRIHLNKRVTRCVLEDRAVKAFEFESGDTATFDYSVMNTDFAYGMQDLFPETERRRYKDSKLEKLKYSCSTFMLYLGVKGEFPEWEHHKIYFAQNYRKNVRQITESLELSNDPSFYIQNASVSDSTLAPKGQSAIYILVPVPNLFADIDWAKEKNAYRQKILGLIRERTGVDLEPLIVEERMITPQDWQDEFRVYKGATFSLAHSWDQMLQFRPRNEFDEFKNLYLVGGGTHPGSGLPTILESGRIAASLIAKRAIKGRVASLMNLRKSFPANLALMPARRVSGMLPVKFAGLRSLLPKKREKVEDQHA